ncbi:hypothetical protein BKA80DRAFT_281127 [Phyllosticta citrichinensis]
MSWNFEAIACGGARMLLVRGLCSHLLLLVRVLSPILGAYGRQWRVGRDEVRCHYLLACLIGGKIRCVSFRPARVGGGGGCCG